MQDAGQEIHAGKISRLPLPFWVFFLLNGWIDAYRLTRAVIGAVRHRVISKAGGPGKWKECYPSVLSLLKNVFKYCFLN